MTPTRRRGNAPLLTIEHAPAYELLHSLVVTVDREDAETYEIGAPWLDEARDRAGVELRARIDAGGMVSVDMGIPNIDPKSLPFEASAEAPRCVGALTGIEDVLSLRPSRSLP